nr:toll/interleukin-1 receptor domain-containing protein [uncultured Thiodictyon sp.]
MTDETYNAFISYAWVDNEPTGLDQSKGWVSTFVDRLRKHLARELGRKVQGDRVWLDYERLRGSDNVTDAIRAKLAASHLLVPILSTGYRDSPWCRQELETFLDQHSGDHGRIFPVWMSPVEDLPAVFSEDLLKYKLWFEDGRRQPRTRWFPDPDPTDREYGQVQQDMARDMAARLVEIFAAEPKPEPVPTPARPAGRDPLPGRARHLRFRQVLTGARRPAARPGYRLPGRGWRPLGGGDAAPR